MPVIEVNATVPASQVPHVDAALMAEVDRLAIEEYGITLPQMMEQAGSHLAEVVRLELGGEIRGRSVVVAAGPGNNGGGLFAGLSDLREQPELLGQGARRARSSAT